MGMNLPGHRFFYVKKQFFSKKYLTNLFGGNILR